MLLFNLEEFRPPFHLWKQINFTQMSFWYPYASLIVPSQVENWCNIYSVDARMLQKLKILISFFPLDLIKSVNNILIDASMQ